LSLGFQAYNRNFTSLQRDFFPLCFLLESFIEALYRIFLSIGLHGRTMEGGCHFLSMVSFLLFVSLCCTLYTFSYYEYKQVKDEMITKGLEKGILLVAMKDSINESHLRLFRNTLCLKISPDGMFLWNSVL
jgi:hypothetical protein